MKLNFFLILIVFSIAFISCSKEDTSGPVITITSPAEGSSLVKGKTYEVMGFITDDTELAEIDLGNNNKITTFDSPTKHTLVNVTFKIPASTVMGSQWVIIISATDKFGNITTKRVSYNIIDDKTSPVVNITSPNEGSTLEKGKNYPVTGTVTDDTELAEIDLGGGSKITAFDSPTKHTLANVNLTIPATATSGSQGSITITAKDKAGNVTTKTVTFTIK
jgi:hypothetical protein